MDNPQDPTSFKKFFEDCAICKQNTYICVNTNISKRRFYVKDFGQLCSGCFYGMHNISTSYNIDLDDMYDYFLDE